MRPTGAVLAVALAIAVSGGCGGSEDAGGTGPSSTASASGVGTSAGSESTEATGPSNADPDTAPVTASPTSAVPTTVAPTTPAPETVAPTTVSPTTPAPTTPAPTTGPVREVVPHRFPVQSAGASYDPGHHDYPAADIFADCGTPFVAPQNGTISEVSRVDVWDSEVNDPATRGGLSATLVGDDGVRYYGSHLLEIAPGIDAGARVAAGQTLGLVGDSGNAAGTGCHLHFGLSRPCGVGDWEIRRGVVWPQPYLDAWKRGEDRAPATEVAATLCG